MSNTREISKSELANHRFICAGYKAVKYDNGTRTTQDFRYAEDGICLTGKVFCVDGKLEACKNGLHFCKKQENVKMFYDNVSWNHYYKVRAYDEVVDSSDGNKSIARIIEFCEEIPFIDFVKPIVNNYSYGSNHSYGNSCSSGNNRSSGNCYSQGSSVCFGMLKCNGSYMCAFCSGMNGIAFRLFNKKVSEERVKEVIDSLFEFGWFPKWTNIYDIKPAESWFIPLPRLKENSRKEAWADMPNLMRNYIKSLPEYDDEIFKKITGEE